jgi:lysophospholipase L1-like esterase
MPGMITEEGFGMQGSALNQRRVGVGFVLPFWPNQIRSSAMGDLKVLARLDETVELVNEQADSKRVDFIKRLEVAVPADVPVRISAEIKCEGVTGVQGLGSAVFFNLEYSQGPIFWDTFLYPETGTTAWRTVSIDVRKRGPLAVAEMHIRHHHKGKLSVRNVTVEALEPWKDDSEVTVLVFGDSTDMVCYLPHEHRLTKRLEMLLRDRFDAHRIDVHGLAEGGETLLRVIDTGRFERELRVFPSVEIVMIRYGLNDINKGVDPKTFGELLYKARDIVAKVHPKAKIVLSTTIPMKTEAYDAEAIKAGAAMGLLVQRLDEMVTQRSAAGDSDWHHQTLGHVGRRRTKNPEGNPTGLLGDLHPNAYGAQMIAEFYFENLEPVVAEMVK